MAFYDRTFSFKDFLGAHPDLQPQLVDALVGNVFKDLRPLFDALSNFAPQTARRPLVTAST